MAMPTLERGNAAKERILLAAIAMVERWGIDGATTRVIAAEAGVNVAAVNYHFRTKNALLGQAIDKVRTQGIQNPLFAIDEELAHVSDRRANMLRKADAAAVAAAVVAAAAAGKNGKKRVAARAAANAVARPPADWLPTEAERRRVLANVLDRVLEDGILHPKAAFAHLRAAIVDHEYASEAVDRTNEIVVGLEGRFHALIAGKSKKEKRLAVAQAWSAIVLASLAPGLFAESTGIDLKDKKARRAFVASLLARTLVAPSTAASRTSRARSKTKRAG